MKIEKEQKGFTLIELLVVLSIFIFSLGAVCGFTIHFLRAADYTFSKALAIGNARKGISSLTRELREATQSDKGDYLLEKCHDFEIIFYSDTDKNKDVEKIRYFLEDGHLKRGVINPSGTPANYEGEEIIKIVSSDIKNTSTPLFCYFDQTYAGKDSDLPLTTPVASEKIDEVGLVGIKMLVDVNLQKGPKIINIESKIHLRNPEIIKSEQ